MPIEITRPSLLVPTLWPPLLASEVLHDRVSGLLLRLQARAPSYSRIRRPCWANGKTVIAGGSTPHFNGPRRCGGASIQLTRTFYGQEITTKRKEKTVS